MREHQSCLAWSTLVLGSGQDDEMPCSHCGSTTGRKIDREGLDSLTDRFFVHGTLQRQGYGGYPALQFNEHRKQIKTLILTQWSDVAWTAI